jgi:hypothetical protein
MLITVIGKHAGREIAHAVPGDSIPRHFPFAAFVTAPDSLCPRNRFPVTLQQFAEGYLGHSGWIDLRSIARFCFNGRREKPSCHLPPK